ncbi:hypothetical protein [Marilutibacter spongiae]|uniref:Uncharacterized protein n=1 Tax=Marilutibacter spongiae TaxID=2025720 RepID=A0A7W3TP40_9GAMM|nr:hypothetical protein [Lysobacter spongiae]MBB1061908.1 hypothetical protein [Lysobacter spongiae]
MATVIPLRPIENALAQANRLPSPPDRRACIRAVLAELKAGRNGQAVAFQLQRTRHHLASLQGGAA